MVVADRLSRFQMRLRELGLAGAILSDPGTVCHLTGFATPIETGPSPFWAGPALALVPAAGPSTLVVADSEPTAAQPGVVDVAAYASYVYAESLDPGARCQVALAGAVRSTGLSGRIGVETRCLPLAVAEQLRAGAPGFELIDISAEAARLRAVKDADEIERLRAAVGLADVGQTAVRELARAGVSELELFSAVRGRMEVAAGQRLPVLADLISGPRTCEVGGPPSGRVVDAGEPVLADLVPWLGGYWADSCNVAFAGEPSTSARRLYGIIRDVLDAATEAVRPGIVAGDLDALVRSRVRAIGREYPHHSGHGLGVTYHEEPRIVPGNPVRLEPGMVLALEPGAYGVDGIGVRLERVLLVTRDGADVLTGFRHGL